MNNATTAAAGTATCHDLAHQYPCGATMTRATFTVAAVAYVAIRFWRADMGTRGIEIYRVDRKGMETHIRTVGELAPLWRTVDVTARALIETALYKRERYFQSVRSACEACPDAAIRGTLLEMR